MTILLAIPVLSPSLGWAQAYTPQRSGWFVGLGGMLGGETYTLKQVQGGITSQNGYRINNTISLLVGLDLIYSRDRGVNYWLVPLAPAVKLNLYEGFYLLAGGGYIYTRATGGTHFLQSTTRNARSYHGYTLQGAAGYDLPIAPNFDISLQAGLDLQYIGNQYLYTPNTRVFATTYF